MSLYVCRKFSQSAAEGSIEKRSRLSTAKSSIVGAWNWFAEGTKRAFTRESLTQPLNYVNKVWDELSQSFGQNCEYQVRECVFGGGGKGDEEVASKVAAFLE